jgi:ribonuclease III
LAKKIELDKFIFVKSHKNLSERVFEDAFEALIGAIYIDRGFKYVKHFVSQKIFVEHINLNQLKYVDTNYKSKIIEWSQKYKIEIEFCTSEDYDDNRNFVCLLKIHDKTVGEGSGISKKIAEQFASKDALEKIKEGDFNLDY